MPRKTIITLLVFALLAWGLYTVYPRERFDAVGEARFAIQERIWNELGRGSEVSCDEPPGTETGATFVCRAAVSGGTAFTFDVSIVDGPAVAVTLDLLG